MQDTREEIGEEIESTILRIIEERFIKKSNVKSYRFRFRPVNSRFTGQIRPLNN